MSCPTEADWGALKRLVRYLIHMPRMAIVYERQGRQKTIDGYSDSDWAGCPYTRRSTSSSYLMHGRHLLASSSTTQTVVATSSGESEFYAAAKTASRTLGAVAMAHDLAMELQPCLKIDANAAKGIASRRGVGKIRHLHVATLWLQQCVHERRLRIDKESGKENIADLGTKYLTAPVLKSLLARAGIRELKGKSALALRAA